MLHWLARKVFKVCCFRAMKIRLGRRCSMPCCVDAIAAFDRFATSIGTESSPISEEQFREALNRLRTQAQDLKP